MEKKASFIASGDSLTTRAVPRTPALDALATLIGSADFRFTNLEITTPDQSCFAGAESSGTWLRAGPEVIRDLRHAYGFNIVAWANNHTLDYSYRGLAETRRHLEENGFVHAGVGETLAEAAKPRYLECKGARVGLVSASSTFYESWRAGPQGPGTIGRPGLNPLRFRTIHMLGENELRQLMELAGQLGINAERDWALSKGFAGDAGGDIQHFGNLMFAKGTPGMRTEVDETDMARIIASIEEAAYQSDYVVVSLHSHECKNADPTLPADFTVDFAHRCIDAGAHAVIGHGAHILQGIELYRGRPIFYSLGNFIFEYHTLSEVPADFYENMELGASSTIANALDKRTRGETIGFTRDDWVWRSILPRWEFEGDELVSLELFPLDLRADLPRGRRGTPERVSGTKTIERLAELSAPFGTAIEKVPDGARVRL